MKPIISALLVEDTLSDADLIIESVADDKKIVFTLVNSLHDALEALAHPPLPDVIVLDLGLPDAEGLDGLRTLIDRVELLPIVVLTGLDDESVGEAAVRAGAEDFLVKGTDMQVMGQVLKRSVRYAVERNTFRKQLVAAKQAALASDRAKFEFLMNMSHELRTPMNAVLGFAQLLQFDQNTPLTQEQNDHVNSIIDGGKHLLDLINQLLDLAKIESDHVAINLEDVDLATVLQEVVVLTAPIASRNQVEVINKVGREKLANIRTDKMRLKQILINLVTNAIKFNKPMGSVTLDAHSTEKGFMKIAVRDTGIGLSPENADRIFENFCQVNANPMLSKEGTGIGLPVAKMLVERLSGHIGVLSQLGEGSEFWFELPLVTNENVLIWAENLRIGIDAIDADHQHLILLLNQLNNHGLDHPDIGHILRSLMEYTVGHFQREEAVMLACGYPEYDRQKTSHDALRKKVDTLWKKWLKDSDPALVGQIHTFLSNWLVDHIIHEDAKIKGFVDGYSEEIRQALVQVSRGQNDKISHG